MELQGTGGKLGQYLIRSVMLASLVFASAWNLTSSYGDAPAKAATLTCRQEERREHSKKKNNAELFARTELFFGRSKPDGSMVTDEQFRRFVDEVITPRFPAGLTVLTGTGQFRGSSGIVMREDSVLLILLYRSNDDPSNGRIEEIRAAYRSAFKQDSVLRVDSPSCVSF
jgi:hypothetical protein